MKPAMGRVSLATVLLAALYPPAANAKAHPTRLELKTEHGKCHAGFDPKKIENLSKRKDLGVWEIDNDRSSDACGDEEVLLCSYIDDTHDTKLLEACASTPVAGVTLNNPFPIKAGAVHRLVCLGRTITKTSAGTRKAQIVALLGPDAAKPCPATPPPEHQAKSREHVIDIEVVP